MAMLNIHIEGGKPRKARIRYMFEYRGERWAIHISHSQKYQLVVTHIETGLSALRTERYSGMYSTFKPVERSNQSVIDEFTRTLDKVRDERFMAVIDAGRAKVAA
jgi:hypothetical protein